MRADNETLPIIEEEIAKVIESSGGGSRYRSFRVERSRRDASEPSSATVITPSSMVRTSLLSYGSGNIMEADRTPTPTRARHEPRPIDMLRHRSVQRTTMFLGSK
jgi:hypothetical protein